jgi:hypothetical protein
MRELLGDLGAFAGVCTICWGLWGIYWPLAAIAGGAALVGVCVLDARARAKQERDVNNADSADPRGNAGESPI